MTAPRLEIHLDRIHHNARTLVERLAPLGIAVTGVTKATLGSPEVARELLRAGVASIGDSRVENIEAMRRAGITAPMTLIRSPMISQADRVVANVGTSLNSELDVIDRLSVAALAQHRTHGVIVMVELGDLREGVLPRDLEQIVRRTLLLPNIDVRGIGTNLACQSGVAPDEHNMAELSALAGSLEASLGIAVEVVSGGNSANLDWALGGRGVGRINDLRLGESILLGLEPLHRRRIDGLSVDAFELVAEVIESRRKPSVPWGDLGQSAFGTRFVPGPPVAPGRLVDRGERWRAIVALGRQDVDPDGLRGPAGWEIVGSSSDHLVMTTGGERPAVGAEVRFAPDYATVLRAMTSPFVSRVFIDGQRGEPRTVVSGSTPSTTSSATAVS